MDGKTVKYRWFILICASVSQGLTYGLFYSVGILYKDWIHYFDSPASFVSFAGGLSTATACLTGPVAGLLVDKFGLRRCGIAGGIICTAGMTLSCMVESVIALCITYGVIAGFGGGLSVFTASAIVNDYFVKDRLLAEGVIGGGLCTGIFLLSLLQQFLVKIFTWRGSMLITGAVCLHISLISIFFIPSSSIYQHPLNILKSFDRPMRKLTEELAVNNNMLDEKQLEILQFSSKRICNSGLKSKGKLNFFERSYLLWRKPVFLVILSADSLYWLAGYMPYVHLVERGRLEGMDEDMSSWLSSTFGLAGIVGRPLTGFICYRFHFHPLWSYCAVQITLGVVTILSSFWSDVIGLFTYAAVFGFLGNGFGLIKASVAYILEPRCFVDAFSWMLLFEGIAIATGPSLAGAVYDITGSYSWSFRVSGSLILISVSLCFLVPFAKRLNCTKEANSRFCENRQTSDSHDRCVFISETSFLQQ